jgi:hypothetical protein
LRPDGCSKGKGDSCLPSYVCGGGDTVLVDEEVTDRSALSDRLFEMLEVAQGYVEAWMAKDGWAVASFMVSVGCAARAGCRCEDAV